MFCSGLWWFVVFVVVCGVLWWFVNQNADILQTSFFLKIQKFKEKHI